MKAAAHVDRVLAPRLPTVGVTLLDRTIAQAIAKYMPEEHATREEQARQTWDVTLHHPNPTEYAGTSELHVTGDTLTLTTLYDRICADRRRPQDRRRPRPPRGPQGQSPRAPRRHPEDQALPAPRHADGRTVGPGREARPRHRRPDPRLGRRTPGSPSNPSSAPTDRPTTDDAVDAHDPPAWMRDLVILRDPTLRVPALPTRRPGLRPRPHRPLRRHRPTRPNPTSQPRPAVPTTPPRQDHRPLAIPPTTRRHLHWTGANVASS